jgi:hypothetical protein
VLVVAVVSVLPQPAMELAAIEPAATAARRS